MELVTLGLEALQSVMEHAASYKFGQSILRHLDRGLWVVEKCARWAVPPPLDQDERPPPPLVRPLPWVFFLAMLLTLRVARESISLVNLIMGKPPLRSADVVVFIQGKRRYLRTLKYQGNRTMRARSSTQPQQPWYRGLYSLVQLTMCFRRESLNYGNNNNTRDTNSDEVVVIKRDKPGRQGSPVSSSGETTMERLIEKMMVDLDAESDEDNNISIATGGEKNDRWECTESDQDTMSQTPPLTQAQDKEISQTNGENIHFSPDKNKHSSSTPEKQDSSTITTEKEEKSNTDSNSTGNQTFLTTIDTDSDKTVNEETPAKVEERKLEQNNTETASSEKSTECDANNVAEVKTCADLALPPPTEETQLPTKQASENFIKNESAPQPSRRTTKKDHKMANGRTVKGVPSKKKGLNHQSRHSNEELQQRVPTSNSTS